MARPSRCPSRRPRWCSSASAPSAGGPGPPLRTRLGGRTHLARSGPDHQTGEGHPRRHRHPSPSRAHRASCRRRGRELRVASGGGQQVPPQGEGRGARRPGAHTPGDEGKWFAAAESAKLFDEAIELANRTPCAPQTLLPAHPPPPSSLRPGPRSFWQASPMAQERSAWPRPVHLASKQAATLRTHHPTPPQKRVIARA